MLAEGHNNHEHSVQDADHAGTTQSNASNHMARMKVLFFARLLAIRYCGSLVALVCLVPLLSWSQLFTQYSLQSVISQIRGTPQSDACMPAKGNASDDLAMRTRQVPPVLRLKLAPRCVV